MARRIPRRSADGLTLGEIAEQTGARLDGAGDRKIQSLAGLASAGPDALSHLSSAGYRDQLSTCRAGAVILRGEDRSLWRGDALVTDNPYLAYARASALFMPPRQHPAGIDTAAYVAPGALVDPQAHIGPGASIGARTRIGAGSAICANASVGADCQIGNRSVIHSGAALCDRVWLGDDCEVHSGAVIGSAGFGYTPDEQGHWVAIAQLGGVRIGNCVSIGANSTVDCGALDDTIIDDGVKIDNLCQIGHNCHIGAHTLICGCVGIVGSTRIGRHCVFAGGSGVGGDGPIELCDGVVVAAMTLISQSISEPGVYAGALLHMPKQRWKRNALRMRGLDDMYRRLQGLERGASRGHTDE